VAESFDLLLNVVLPVSCCSKLCQGN